MKVVLVNGSPHEKGCTYTALAEVAQTLKKENVETEFFWLGNKPLSGCIACRNCAEKKRCVFDDRVNEFLAIAASFDGFIFGTPVHWAGASGALTSFLDRVFYADNCGGLKSFYLKPAAAVMSARRAGTTATYDQVNKYFGLMQMPIISSQYWNMVHGSTPEDVQKDLEGLQTMRTLARNMAFFLRCQEAGLQAGVPLPAEEKKIVTNFIR
ncbi:MAG: flavodoxin family protein [Candidatus Margulisbacteria bacterium]|jgi:multimeric flavodoxin WrbA|nr:flavodoxin family protein [Candidatus Margulisiibacteriota bacterium]